jgi:Caspase domain/Effector-associated domain 11
LLRTQMIINILNYLVLSYYSFRINLKTTLNMDTTQRAIGNIHPEQTPAPFTRGTNYFLAVAIDEYESTYIHKLDNCVNDARAIVKELVEHYDFEEGHTQIIPNEHATQRNILKALDYYSGLVEKDDSFIFLYSGHGVKLEFHKDGDTDNYRKIGTLVPTNAVDEFDYIDISVIKNRLDTFKAKHILVILDSCYSGLIFSQRDVQRSAYIPENFPSRFALTSGRDTPVADGEGIHSPFAKAILTQLALARTNDNKLGAVALSQAIMDGFSSDERYKHQLPYFGTINPDPTYTGQYYFYPKNYNPLFKSDLIRETVKDLNDLISDNKFGQAIKKLQFIFSSAKSPLDNDALKLNGRWKNLESAIFYRTVEWKDEKEEMEAIRNDIVRLVQALKDNPSLFKNYEDANNSINQSLEGKQSLNTTEREVLNYRLAYIRDKKIRIKCLWIDDTPLDDQNEENVLTSIGLDIDRAESFESAAEMISANNYDLIISDRGRDDNSEEGNLFLKRLVEIKKKRLPFIFYVGKDDGQTPKYAFGITQYPNELFHLVMDFIERKY